MQMENELDAMIDGVWIVSVCKNEFNFSFLVFSGKSRYANPLYNVLSEAAL
jgi:hypothetical protein